MEHFPREVVNLILEFQGYHKYRNGKYMKQILPEDERYDALRRKPWNHCYYQNDYGRFYRTIFYKKIENEQYTLFKNSLCSADESSSKLPPVTELNIGPSWDINWDINSNFRWYKIVIHSINYGGKLHWYMNVLYFDGIREQTAVWKKHHNKSIHYVY